MSFGIALGYKRTKWLFDLSTSEDEALYAFGLRGYAVGGGSGYVSNRVMGITFNRTTATVGARLGLFDQRSPGQGARWEVWGTLGAIRWRRPSGPDKIIVQGEWRVSASDTIVFNLDQNTQVSKACSSLLA